MLSPSTHLRGGRRHGGTALASDVAFAVACHDPLASLSFRTTSSGGQSGGSGSWSQADLGELRTSDEWHPCSKGYRLALFCGREIQVDTGPQTASRSVGACRRRSVAGWCLYQWTHSAVASTGGVDVRPGLEVLPVVVNMGVDDLLRRSRRPRDADTLSLCAHDLIGLTQLSRLQHRLPHPGRLVDGGSRPQATVDLSLLELGA